MAVTSVFGGEKFTNYEARIQDQKEGLKALTSELTTCP